MITIDMVKVMDTLDEMIQAGELAQQPHSLQDATDSVKKAAARAYPDIPPIPDDVAEVLCRMMWMALNHRLPDGEFVIPSKRSQGMDDSVPAGVTLQ